MKIPWPLFCTSLSVFCFRFISIVYPFVSTSLWSSSSTSWIYLPKWGELYLTGEFVLLLSTDRSKSWDEDTIKGASSSSGFTLFYSLYYVNTFLGESLTRGWALVLSFILPAGSTIKLILSLEVESSFFKILFGELFTTLPRIWFLNIGFVLTGNCCCLRST